MTNPILPPSIAAEFKNLADRVSALERGERSLVYRDRLPVNDSEIARSVFSRDGNKALYAAALVNPRYPVLVARYHVLLFGSGTAETQLKAVMGTQSTVTRKILLSGKTNPDAWTWNTLEIAWLHGIDVDRWEDTENASATRRGNIEIRFQVTKDHVWFERNPSLEADLRAAGFTDSQNAVLRSWFRPYEALYETYFREPEYVFLAPLNAFPTATPEGTLLPGSVVYP